ncbi:MAG: alpha/beta hydrolase [Pseudomonadota bacterium]
MSESGFISVGATKLETLRCEGGRAAPTLVLLHEGLGCCAMWRQFPEQLAEATGLDVFAYSRAGYGASSPINLPRALDYHTREALDILPQVLEGAAIGDCILVGHSDGASIAIVYQGEKADPRVRGLVLMAPHVMTEKKSVLTITEAGDIFRGTNLRERLARYHGDNVDGAFWGWRDAWVDPMFRRWSIEQHLGSIKVPVLTIRGDDDQYSTAQHVLRINAKVSGPVKHVGLPCQHSPPTEATDDCVAAIADYIRERGLLN